MPKADGHVQTRIVKFFQTPGDGEYVAAIPLPAACYILNYGMSSPAIWDCDSAAVEIGDAADADGFMELGTGVNLTNYPKAGQTVDYIGDASFPAAYTNQTASKWAIWSPVARDMIFKITQVGGGTGGESLGFVTYVVPVEVATALKA